MLAAHAGSFEGVDLLLDRGADCSAAGVIAFDGGPGGSSGYYGGAVAVAAATGRIDMVRALFEKCSPPVDQREWKPAEGAATGWTPLQWAAARGQTEVVEYVLARGADVDAGPASGEAPLALALRGGHLEVARRLVAAGATVDIEVRPGVTPLHVAVNTRALDLAVELADAGARVEAERHDGKTPIDLAFDNGEDGLTQRFYCRATSEFRDRRTPDLVRRAEEWEDSALASFFAAPACDSARIARLIHIALRRDTLADAARRGDAAEVARLLAEGIPVDERDRDGATPLLWAAESGSLETIRLLVSSGADCSAVGRIYDKPASARGFDDLFLHRGEFIGGPLARSAMRGDLAAVRLLIEECGVPVDEREWEPASGDRSGWTALQRAANEGHDAVAAYLLQRGADVEGGNDGPATPLMLAARQGNLDVVHSLLKAGARPNHDFALGTSLLYLAATAEETLFRLAYCATPGSLRSLHAAELREIAVEAGNAHFAAFIESPSCSETELDDLVHAHTLTRLSVGHWRAGRFGEAAETSTLALEIRARILGDEHVDVAESLNGLAVARLYQGDLPAALTLHERALTIRRKAMGDEHVDVAISLNNLAFAYAALGDHERALPLYRRSLELRERLSSGDPEDLALIATALSNLGDIHYTIGDFAEALDYQERALDIRTRIAEDDQMGYVAETTMDVALVRSALGDHSRARELGENAVRMVSQLGDHVDLAQALNSFALVLLQAGAPEASLEAYERALSSRQRLLGEGHATVAESAAGAARAALATGSREAMVEHMLRGAATVSYQIENVLSLLSLAEQRALLQRLVPTYTGLLLTQLPGTPEFAEGYGNLLRWKGALLRGLRQQQAIAVLEPNAATEAEATALRRVRSELGAWYYRAQDVSAEEWRARSDSLSLVKERLERSLAAAAPETVFSDTLEAIGLPGLQDQLRDGEAFVDIYRYEPVTVSDPRSAGFRYSAIVTSRGRVLQAVDLGSAALVEADLAAWLDRVAGERRHEDVWTALEETLWRPIRKALPVGTTSLWISPDAALARLPWNLFSDTLPVSIVDSPRELAHILTRPSAERKPAADLVLLVGNIDFGRGTAPSVAPPLMQLAPLPATEKEVTAIASLGAALDHPVRTLSGSAATREALRSALPGAAYAHLATHGFFGAGQTERSVVRGAQESFRDPTIGGAEMFPPLATGARNPLVESGFALAGANLPDASGVASRGRLTAEELVGLDLSTVRLFTLSACDTGRGHEITGQGVIGLRSAILSAGARSVLMSLWRVDDEATALLMEEFYRGLWSDGLAPAAALRRAQLAVRNHPSGAFESPSFWAAWVVAGEAW